MSARKPYHDTSPGSATIIRYGLGIAILASAAVTVVVLATIGDWRAEAANRDQILRGKYLEADVGITGADRGRGGKYLVLPPGYKGKVPKGYFGVRPSTYGNWLVFRSFLVDGSPKPGVESVKKTLKIYNLVDAAKPPAISGLTPSSSRHARRAS